MAIAKWRHFIATNITNIRLIDVAGNDGYEIEYREAFNHLTTRDPRDKSDNHDRADNVQFANVHLDAVRPPPPSPLPPPLCQTYLAGNPGLGSNVDLDALIRRLEIENSAT